MPLNHKTLQSINNQVKYLTESIPIIPSIPHNNSPRVLHPLSSQWVFRTSVTHFLRVKILRFIIRQETLCKCFILRPKLIDVIDFLAAQPLRGRVVLQNYLVGNIYLLPDRVETMFWAHVLKYPNTVSVLGSSNGDLLMTAEF